MTGEAGTRIEARRRRSSAGDEARDRLLDTAEQLFADYGLDGASMRQIRLATGNANNSFVQYHFGDKAGLIREIINRRNERMEPHRRRLLDEAEAQGRLGDIRTLLEIIYLPLASATDAEGHHVFARFLMQFLTNLQYRDGMPVPGLPEQSANTRAARLLKALLPDLALDLFSARVLRVGHMFMIALVDRDNARAQGRQLGDDQAFFDDVFAMMAAAIAAAPPTGRRSG